MNKEQEYNLHLLDKKIRKSISIISKMLELSNNPYLAISFGKDSLVMAELVRQLQPDIPCLMKVSNETFLMNNYADIIPFYVDRGYNITFVIDDRLSYMDEMDILTKEKAGRDGWQHPAFLQYDGVFMGLRIQESKARRMTLTMKKNNVIADKIMRYKGGVMSGRYRCCPVSYWNEFEIMHYLKTMELPLLKRYGNYNGKERTVTALFAESISMGEIEKIKAEDIERYNLLKLKYSKIKNLGR